MSEQGNSVVGVVCVRVYASALALIGLVLAGGGGYLLSLGGSPYYLLCGAAVIVSAVLLFLRRGAGALLYGLTLLATLIWAVWECGYDGWALMPRVVWPAVLGAILLLPPLRRALIRPSPAWHLTRGIFTAAAAVAIGALLHAFVPPRTPVDPLYQAGIGPAPAAAATVDDSANGDWRNYGNDRGGSRYSPLAQITPNNVSQLKLAWAYKIDAISSRTETTPLKIDRTLYLCNTFNDVIALDAETGNQLWRFEAHVDTATVPTPACRGVAYYKVPRPRERAPNASSPTRSMPA
jgi:quinoprotein glucose dehydrogenase